MMMEGVENIMGVSVGVLVLLLLLLMLFLILILFLLACKPWRFFSSSSSSLLSFFRSRFNRVGGLERPLVSDLVQTSDEDTELVRNYDLENQNEGLLHSPRTQGRVFKQRIQASAPHRTPVDSVILDLVSDSTEDISVGQTLKASWLTERLAEVQAIKQEDQSPSQKYGIENEAFRDYVPKVIAEQNSCLSLEVISGPCRGLRCTVQSTSASRLPLTLGRVSSDLVLKDSEVSGKHAMINWNVDRKKWELLDMGSLNGTVLNDRPINHPDSGSRHWGDPVEISNGDIVTLGTTSNIYVSVTSESEIKTQIPFSVGMASDPMALRRGGKKLPMEDVCYFHWPLPSVEQFGVFGICDGHGGVSAANSASKLLPEKITGILSDSTVRERVLSQCDASDVFRVAFSQTEASMENHYEMDELIKRSREEESKWQLNVIPEILDVENGCTATVLLIWTDGNRSFFAQCANLGDSACVINVHGKQIKMTEDHRITSYSERLRINEMGEPLKDGETRLCGLNLARMLGDKFLKQQEPRFSSEPYISHPVHISQASDAFALLASDGFWDVISIKKAIQLVHQSREKYSGDGENNPAEKVANFLLSEAKNLRTKDNTSIIFLDFDTKSRKSLRIDS